jgi:hypothetical protein
MDDSAQNARKFLVTRAHDDGEYSRHLDYLLENGSRRRVTIESASDSETLRQRIGEALHKKEVEGKRWTTQESSTKN